MIGTLVIITPTQIEVFIICLFCGQKNYINLQHLGKISGEKYDLVVACWYLIKIEEKVKNEIYPVLFLRKTNKKQRDRGNIIFYIFFYYL